MCGDTFSTSYVFMAPAESLFAWRQTWIFSFIVSLLITCSSALRA